jgi:hypothetical protein
MPNRIIKESIRESPSIDQLSPQAEILFYRLLTFADDYGLFKSDPRLLKAALFPLKDCRSEQVGLWLDDVAATGMISFYVGSDGKPYGTFNNWERHQIIRNKKPKHPPPNSHKFQTVAELMLAIEINCNQLPADESGCVSNPIQSNPNPNPISCQNFPQDSDAIRLSMLLFSLVKKRDEKAKEPNLQKWAVHIDRLIKIDQRTPNEIEQVIRWCQEDQFWQNNILSSQKLRDQFTQLTLKMNKSTGKLSEDAFDKKLARIKNMAEKKDDQGGI